MIWSSFLRGDLNRGKNFGVRNDISLIGIIQKLFLLY
jgi:hypothetical protein